MKCSERRSWGKPSEQLITSDPRYGTVTVTAWHGLHPKLAGRGRWAGEDAPPIVKGSVMCVEVEHLPKQDTLGWTSPSVCTPEQAERWTWLVIAMLTQLRLARDHVDDIRLPWERPRERAQLTPSRTRRGFRRFRAVIGTPASPPKFTKAGPGRPKGTRRPPRTRFPAIKKAA